MVQQTGRVGLLSDSDSDHDRSTAGVDSAVVSSSSGDEGSGNGEETHCEEVWLKVCRLRWLTRLTERRERRIERDWVKTVEDVFVEGVNTVNCVTSDCGNDMS